MPPAPPRNFREAHAHLHSLGESLELVSLADCRDVAHCLGRIAAAAANPCDTDDGWLRFSSARVQAWAEQRWPTLDELDATTGDRPCVIMSFDHHAAAANSAALAAAGLAPGQRVAPAGEVIADPRTGRPTGLLLEYAAYRVWEASPAPTPARQQARVAAALSHLAVLGYEEVHDLHSQPWLGPLLHTMEAAGQLNLRATLYPPFAALAQVAADRASWESGNIRLGGGKVFADGTLNSRTACMLHRYAEPMPNLPRGQAMHSPMALDAMVQQADAHGLPLAFHAIGDCAVRMVLDTIENNRPRTGGYRVEHAEIIDRTDVPRFAKLGVIASVQPCHLLADVEALARFVPHRLDRVLPLRELIDSGCKPGELLWFGSDVPIVDADPADSIRAAVDRRRHGAAPGDAIAPEQAITQAEAWSCFRPGV